MENQEYLRKALLSKLRTVTQYNLTIPKKMSYSKWIFIVILYICVYITHYHLWIGVHIYPTDQRSINMRTDSAKLQDRRIRRTMSYKGNRNAVRSQGYLRCKR